MNVNRAEKPARVESVSNVRGKEHTQEAIATIAENTMVQTPLLPLVMVLRYFAPVRQWKPWMNVLLSRNMIAVNHHAHFLPQNSICPISQTSLTSGWRKQNSLM